MDMIFGIDERGGELVRFASSLVQNARGSVGDDGE